MFVSKTGCTGGTATITVQIVEGNIPAVGALISIQGTQQGSGSFNVTNAAITAVSITKTTGIGTIQFALAGTVTSSGDAGIAIAVTPEIGEFLVAQAWQAFAVPEPAGNNTNPKTITWSTAFPSAPAAVTVALQASLFDIDSQYQTIDTSTNPNGEERVYTGTSFRFLRLKTSGNSGGTNATFIGKIYI